MSDFDSIFVGGHWRAARGTDELPVIGPYTEKLVTTVRGASAQDVDDAVRSAHAALRTGPWSEASLEERCAVVERIRDGMLARKEELIDRAVATLGQPISRARQVSSIGSRIDREIKTIKEIPLESQRDDDSGRTLVSRKPAGVVAGICPFNAPTMMEIKKSVPALLAGCTVVLKSDPQTPYASRILAEVAAEAGLPPGVLNVVFGGAPTGDALVRHPLVNTVTFTGSAPTGAAIGAAVRADVQAHGA